MTCPQKMFCLDGLRAVVTGGTGAIGLEMSKTLVNAGCRVIIWSRSAENIEKALSELQAEESLEVSAMQVDSGDEEQVQNALHNIAVRQGPVHILINCAGGNRGRSPLVETDINGFREILESNLVAGLMVPTKVFSAYWIEHRIRGTIINLASMTSFQPLSGVWAYNAAKAGVLNLTQASARELAVHDIRVNAIAPGFFVGRQNRDLLFEPGGDQLTQRGQSIIARTPFGRFGKVEELAGVTLFLASESASGFVTGICIPVDGGYLVNSI